MRPPQPHNAPQASREMSQVTGLANWFLRLPLTWAVLAVMVLSTIVGQLRNLG